MSGYGGACPPDPPEPSFSPWPPTAVLRFPNSGCSCSREAPVWDGVEGLAIGLLLIAEAVFVGTEVTSLLLNEAPPLARGASSRAPVLVWKCSRWQPMGLSNPCSRSTLAGTWPWRWFLFLPGWCSAIGRPLCWVWSRPPAMGCRSGSSRPRFWAGAFSSSISLGPQLTGICCGSAGLATRLKPCWC